MHPLWRVRDAIHERLLATPICSTEYRQFLSARHDLDRMRRHLISQFHFMLVNGYVTEADLMAMIDADDFDISDCTSILVFWSAKHDRADFLDWFLSRAKPRPPLNEALYWASVSGCLSSVNVLLAHGADPNGDDSRALRYSAFHGHLDVVDRLLEAGANSAARNHEAHRYAVRNNCLLVASRLAPV